MKVFIPLICIASLALAEPPVGDGYAPSRSSHHHDHSLDFQRPPSQEYGPPTNRAFGSSRNDLSIEYGPPNARTASLRSSPSQNYGTPNHGSRISQEYGAPNIKNQISSSRSLSTDYGLPHAQSSLSSDYGVPNARSSPSSIYGVPASRVSPSTEYGVPNARSSPSEKYGVPSARSSLSQEYGVPTSGRDSLSQEYGVPAALRSSPSQEYGVPSARLPSSQYGVPEFRSGPSKEYGVPSQRSFGARTPSQKYGLPTSRNFLFSPNSLSQEYGVPSARTADSQGFTAPKSIGKGFGSSSARSFKPQSQARSSFGSRIPSTSYGNPSTRNSDSYTHDTKAPSQSYGAPARDLSDTYGVPNARDLSQEYGVPSSRADDQKTNAIASSYSAAASRSSPSDTYIPPPARDSIPSEQYGVPDQYSKQNNRGYPYARDALNELLNQEPANYDFSYKVNDYESGSDFGHTESRQENRAEGSYFVVLPDGTKQTVEYEADERGFKPRISVEPADLGRLGGYDDNAADLARSGDGPY